jgi:hypothetical protein
MRKADFFESRIGKPDYFWKAGLFLESRIRIKRFDRLISLRYAIRQETCSLKNILHNAREIYQIIVITIANNNFRLRYVSSKLDQVLLLLLLTNKL